MMNPDLNGIAIGRIVHYVLDGGEHRPAVIVRVWPNEFGDDPGVNLQVLVDGSNDAGQIPASSTVSGVMWRTSVRYSEIPQPGTFHWPERK